MSATMILCMVGAFGLFIFAAISFYFLPLSKWRSEPLVLSRPVSETRPFGHIPPPPSREEIRLIIREEIASALKGVSEP